MVYPVPESPPAGVWSNSLPAKDGWVVAYLFV